MTTPGRRYDGERGFTLAELLVAMAIIGLVMSGMLTLFMSSQQSFLIGAGQVDAQQNVRVAFDMMAREVRQAGYDPTNIGFPAVIGPGGGALTATSLMLQNDWNGNGIIEPGIVVVVGGVNRGERVTYTINGALLTRLESAVDAAPQVVIAGIDLTGAGPNVFTYFDAAGAPTAVAGNVASVGLMLQTRPTTTTATRQTEGNVHVRLADTVRLRNR